MNTKLIMTLSAIFMLVAGVLLSFLPQEVAEWITGVEGGQAAILMLQVMGALYFAFGMLNWTARANLIGGIYSRPVAIGNLCHFVIGGLALLKGYFVTYELWVGVAAVVYTGFAIVFSWIFFTHPVSGK